MIGRLMGIDHGLKRVGVAVSDGLGISARELTIVHYNNPAELYRALKRLAQEQLIVGVVIGLPTNEGNTEQADIVQAWATELYAQLKLPQILWDEQLSSADAKALAREQRRKPQAPIDDLAARVILQSYLNALADGLAMPPAHPPQA